MSSSVKPLSVMLIGTIMANPAIVIGTNIFKLWYRASIHQPLNSGTALVRLQRTFEIEKALAKIYSIQSSQTLEPHQ